MLAVLGGLHPGGGAKAAQKGSLAQAGARGHVRQARFGPIRPLQPVLHRQHGSIAMVEAGREAAEMALRFAVQVHHQKARSLGGNGRPQQARHQGQTEIGPGHQTTSGNQVAVIDHHAFGQHPHLRKARRQRPMDGHRAAIEQTGLDQREGTDADRRQQHSSAVPLTQLVAVTGRERLLGIVIQTGQ